MFAENAQEQIIEAEIRSLLGRHIFKKIVEMLPDTESKLSHVRKARTHLNKAIELMNLHSQLSVSDDEGNTFEQQWFCDCKEDLIDLQDAQIKLELDSMSPEER